MRLRILVACSLLVVMIGVAYSILSSEPPENGSPENTDGYFSIQGYRVGVGDQLRLYEDVVTVAFTTTQGSPDEIEFHVEFQDEVIFSRSSPENNPSWTIFLGDGEYRFKGGFEENNKFYTVMDTWVTGLPSEAQAQSGTQTTSGLVPFDVLILGVGVAIAGAYFTTKGWRGAHREKKLAGIVLVVAGIAMICVGLSPAMEAASVTITSGKGAFQVWGYPSEVNLGSSYWIWVRNTGKYSYTLSLHISGNAVIYADTLSLKPGELGTIKLTTASSNRHIGQTYTWSVVAWYGSFDDFAFFNVHFPPLQYTLTTSVYPSWRGTVSPSSGTYNSGSSVKLTATPYSGYKFDHWSGDASGTTNPITITMNSNKSITANFTMVPFYTLKTYVSPSGAGSVSGAGTYEEYTSVAIRATPAKNYRFDHWGGDASGSTNPTTVFMNRNKTVYAYFKYVPPEYTLKTYVSPSGAGSVSGAGTYKEGTSVEIFATPYSGYRFDYWTGDASGSTNPITITMNSNKSITANFFIPIQYYALSVSVAGGTGTVSGAGTYREGTSVVISASPAKDYKFEHWGGDASGTSSSTTVVMSRNKTVYAYFKYVPPPVYHNLYTSVSPSGAGTVTPSSGKYLEGTRLTIKASPSTGYEFDRWSGDASGTSSTITITMDRNKSVIANFKIVPPLPPVEKPEIWHVLETLWEFLFGWVPWL